MNKDKINIKFNILAIICIMIFCFAVTPITFQNDTYYTISIGRHIVETEKVDMQDPFSWHENLPYTYPHWAYDVGTYLVYQLGENVGIGGFCAVYIATVLLSMTLGIVIYYIINKLSKNSVVAFSITIAIMYLLEDFIAARAQLVTFILFALTILFIERFIDTKKKRYAIYLIIIPILIANLHCAVWPFYFILFLPYIVEYLLASITEIVPYYWLKIKLSEIKLKKLIKNGKTEQIGNQQEKIARLQLEKEKLMQNNEKRRKNPYKIIFEKNENVKWLIVILIISIFTGLITPLGMTPYTYLIKTLQGNTTQSISEHQPLTLIKNKPILIVFSLYLMILTFTDTKIRLRDLFMLSGLTLLSFMSRRQTSMFVIICGIIFAKLLANLLQKYDKKGSEDFMKFASTILGGILTITVVSLLSILLYRGKIGDKYINENNYPVGVAEYILTNFDVNNIRIFNEYNYGSYLIFRGIPVFIDSRADLYAPEFNGKKNEEGKYEGRNIFSDYINISNINSHYEKNFEKYGITHVVVRKKTKLNMLLSKDKNYKELYKDSNFVFYDRLSK